MERINTDCKINDELEKFRINFSRCRNRDVAPLTLTFNLFNLFNSLYNTVQERHTRLPPSVVLKCFQFMLPRLPSFNTAITVRV